MTLNHAFVSGKADGADATLARASNWNAAHVVGAYSVGTAPIMVAANDATDREKAMALLSGGAVCDGTDDDVQLQAAIDLCTGTRWQTLRFLGTFSTSAALVGESYTRIQLDGKIKPENAANVHIITYTSKSHFVIEGGDWDGNKANAIAADAYNCMELSTCTYFVIEKATIHDPHVSLPDDPDNGGSNGLCIVATSCDWGVIEDCEVYGAGHFVGLGGPPAIRFAGGGSDNKVERCNVHTSDGGIYFISQDAEVACRNKIYDNTVSNVYRDGISIYNKDMGGGSGHHRRRHHHRRNHLLNCGKDDAHPGIVIGNYEAGQLDHR